MKELLSFVRATLILHAKPTVSHMAVRFGGCWPVRAANWSAFTLDVTQLNLKHYFEVTYHIQYCFNQNSLFGPE